MLLLRSRTLPKWWATVGLAVIVAGCGTVSPAKPRPSSQAPRPADEQVVDVGRAWRVGRWVLPTGEVFRDPGRVSLAGFERLYGPPGSCSMSRYSGAVARWRKAGFSGYFSTLGAITRNGAAVAAPDYCQFPDQVQIDHVIVSGPGWRTARGLRIGDTSARMLERYPAAADHEGDRFAPGWWLHTTRHPWDPGTDVADLTARLSHGRVTSFRIDIGAEGE